MDRMASNLKTPVYKCTYVLHRFGL